MIRARSAILASALTLAFSLSGCAGSAGSEPGGDPGATPPDESVGSTTEAWTVGLPGTSGLTPGPSVVVSGCKFTVGTAVKTGTLPPQRVVYVQKSAVFRGSCPSKKGFTSIGSSYGTPGLSIAKHPTWPFIAASFTYKSTPSGEAHQLASIAQVSFGTGAILRTTGLAAMSPGINQPQLGNIQSMALAIDADGNLSATGAYDGVLPGATGSGSSYTAVWTDFIWDITPSPAPSSIVLF